MGEESVYLHLEGFGGKKNKTTKFLENNFLGK